MAAIYTHGPPFSTLVDGICGPQRGAVCKGPDTGERDMKFVMIGLLACTALAACETVQGAGRDLQSAGRAVEQAAD